MTKEKTIDVRMTVRAQNGKLVRLAEEMGSYKAVAKKLGISTATFGGWVNFRSSPVRRIANGKVCLSSVRMKRVVKRLCKLCKCHVSDLFPELTAAERAVLSRRRQCPVCSPVSKAQRVGAQTADAA